MAEDLGNEIRSRVSKIFIETVGPLLDQLILEFNGINGIEAAMVTDIPVIMGIKEYKSILFKTPSGVEHVVCIYWIEGEEKIVAENIRMVTLNRSFDIFDLNAGELKKTIKVLAGLGKHT
jgi:hypothetical protein